MLSMFLLLPLFWSLCYSVIYFDMLISVALMNSHNRFVNNPPHAITHPPPLEEKMVDNPPLILRRWTIFGGTLTLTINPN